MAHIHYDHCPICQSVEIRPVFLVKDYTVSGESYPVVACNQCSLRFTQDVPDQDSIGPYYKSEDYISHTNVQKGLINGLYQKVRAHTMEKKAAMVAKYTHRKSGRLLDVGCGTGTFLHTMQQKGWQVEGLEPDAGARELAVQLSQVSVLPSHEIFSLPLEQYDAITLWHVLEHVHDLQGYMQQLKKLLKPSGVLFIAVPNYTSMDAHAYEQFWAAYDVPRHLYHFSPTSMERLVDLHGLKITGLLPMWFDSFYVSLLSSKYKFGKVNYVSAGMHGLSSNINAWRKTTECSSVIYIIQQQAALVPKLDLV